LLIKESQYRRFYTNRNAALNSKIIYTIALVVIILQLLIIVNILNPNDKAESVVTPKAVSQKESLLPQSDYAGIAMVTTENVSYDNLVKRIKNEINGELKTQLDALRYSIQKLAETHGHNLQSGPRIQVREEDYQSDMSEVQYMIGDGAITEFEAQ
jgi:hypothetical protein